MSKVVNPHLLLPLSSPICGASHIEIHDTFAIWYDDPWRSRRQFGGNGGIIFDDPVLNEKVRKNAERHRR